MQNGAYVHSYLKTLDRIIIKKKRDGTEKKKEKRQRDKESAVCLLIIQLSLLKNVLISSVNVRLA